MNLTPGKDLITPECADEILRECRYPKQRALRDDRVLYLAEELVAERWEPTVITLCPCAETGLTYLVDGQHRLSAIPLAKKPAPLNFVLEPKRTLAEVDAAYRVMDAHAKRTLQDRLRASDLPDKLGLNDWELRQLGMAIPPLADGFVTNHPYSMSHNPMVRHDELRMQLMREWAGDARLFFDCLRGATHGDRNRFRNGTMIAFAILTMRYQPVKAQEFWTAIALNDGLLRGTPQWYFRNQIMEQGRKNHHSAEMARRMASCWNAYMTGKTINSTVVKNLAANINILGTPYSYHKQIRLYPPKAEETQG